MKENFAKETAVPDTRRRHFAIELGGRFHPLRAGVQGHGAAPAQESRPWHYFGGAVVRRPQSGGTTHSLSAVRVLGDRAQDALMAALEEAGGHAVSFLCWYDGVPPAEAERRGNGFKGRCALALTGAETAGGTERIRYTLSEVGGRQHGNVRLEEDGMVSLSPMYGGRGGGVMPVAGGAAGNIGSDALAGPAAAGEDTMLTAEAWRLGELLDWAESLADCLMQGYVGEE